MTRTASLRRKTGETDIEIKINIDGTGISDISSGIGFFDHMLTLFARHGNFDLIVKAQGDLDVDCHHTVEDVGIVLGQIFKEALGDKTSIKRYGTVYIPMDEALAFVTLDISNRAFLVFEADLSNLKVGDMDAEMVEEFFRAFAVNAGITLHAKVLYGSNTHHKIEALFKAFSRALKEASAIDSTITGVMSTKGIL
jgi:imidazoleglycerol-phosphate dehydratase